MALLCKLMYRTTLVCYHIAEAFIRQILLRKPVASKIFLYIVFNEHI